MNAHSQTRRRRSARPILLAALVATPPTAANPALADEALVAVAANFADTMKTLELRFEGRTGHRLEIATGSTGKLYAQIRHGAPFHALLAADRDHPRRLESEGAAVPDTRFTYAVGRLVLWSPDSGRIGPRGAAALTGEDIRHIAIANPKLAPYGLAARQTLEALNLWDRLLEKIATGENAAQAFSMVASGNAELGFIPLAMALSLPHERRGSRWDVPDHLYTPIRQDAVLLEAGRDNSAARAFLDFLRSTEARKIIEGHGYGLE